MKILLGFSLLINLILGVLFFQEKNKPPLERIVLEHDRPQVITRTKEVVIEKEIPSSENSNKVKASLSIGDIDPHAAKVVEEISEKVSNDRLEFLTSKLNMGAQDLDQLEKIKDEYFKNLQKVAPTPGEELSVDQRRRMLELEMVRDQQISKLMGNENWEKFKKFKKDYNKRMYEEQTGEYGVVVPLDI